MLSLEMNNQCFGYIETWTSFLFDVCWPKLCCFSSTKWAHWLTFLSPLLAHILDLSCKPIYVSHGSHTLIPNHHIGVLNFSNLIQSMRTTLVHQPRHPLGRWWMLPWWMRNLCCISVKSRNRQQVGFVLTGLALSKPNRLRLNRFGSFETGP